MSLIAKITLVIRVQGYCYIPLLTHKMSTLFTSEMYSFIRFTSRSTIYTFTQTNTHASVNTVERDSKILALSDCMRERTRIQGHSR